jgi:hypothetical protein
MFRAGRFHDFFLQHSVFSDDYCTIFTKRIHHVRKDGMSDLHVVLLGPVVLQTVRSGWRAYLYVTAC